MSNTPTDLKYSSTHEWAKLEDDGRITVGITDHAQSLLGDIVFVELPEIETEVGVGDEVGVIESVKAASDLYTPITGQIIEVNTALSDTPELINEDPYGAGWIYRVMPDDVEELRDLLESDDYLEEISD
jgi:glycine cleavage system H protein